MAEDLEIIQAFECASKDPKIISARLAVLETVATEFAGLADRFQASGFVLKDDRILASALLLRLASELSASIALLVRNDQAYSAGALLRQLIEIEYLVFIGYTDPANLSQWYRSTSDELRTLFSPNRMRKASDGLFRDQEYWLHCEVGGHPHPRSRMLLAAYSPPMSPVAVMLPDSVQHLWRLWTSVKLLCPKLGFDETVVAMTIGEIEDSFLTWRECEHPIVQACDGISI